MNRISRREFVRCAGLAGMGAVGPRLGVQAGSESVAAVSAEPELVIRVYDGTGKPHGAGALPALFLFEMSKDRNPLPHPRRRIEDGIVRFVGGPDRCGISMILSVDGFGTMRLYADAGGAGYAPGAVVELNRELAHSRLVAVERVMSDCKRGGVVFPSAVEDRLGKSRFLLERADKEIKEPARWVPLAMESLRESLWAGEEVVLARARHAIARRGQRKGFLFGCNFFKYPAQGED
ncbi:MAG: hypothetical protein ACP5MD_13485, partial [Verrucomicrobiia bacterium]